MSPLSPLRVFQDERDRRTSDRFPVAIPAIVLFGGREYSARLINIAQGGAKIEASAPLVLHSILELRAGTVAVRAVVVWLGSSCVGVNFNSVLTDCQVAEQVSRSIALATRRSRRHHAKPTLTFQQA